MMNTSEYSGNLINEVIFPIKIVATHGNVENAASLLQKKTLQITTNESDCAILKNSFNKKSYIILDFGKEINAKLRLLTYTLSGCSTADLRITYGESIAEAMSDIGKNGATNDHSTRDFTFSFPQYSDITLNESGFRYAKIELLKNNAEIKIKSVVAVAVYRDLEYLGSFRCDNEKLNKIFDTAAYTCHLSMQQYIWDGIKRDRLVWVGDMHPEMLTVRTVFGPNRIIADSINFMRETTPLPDWMNGMPTYSLWWLIILYDWYLYSADTQLISDNKSYCLKLTEQVINQVNDDGSDNLPSYFLDWPCNEKPQSKTGSRALLILALDAAEKLCVIFGYDDIAGRCKKKKQCLLNTDFVSFGAKQVTAFGAMAGWTDEEKAAAEILRNGAEGWSTFMSYYLLKVSGKYNMTETLNALISYYGAMLDLGATTFWEDFDLSWAVDVTGINELPVKGKKNIHTDFGDFCYKGLRHSLCHGWSSAPTAFLAEEVLGIKIMSPGCKNITISPSLGNLKFAEGTYPTPYGIIKISCEYENGNIIVKYNSPDEITVNVENAIYGGTL